MKEYTISALARLIVDRMLFIFIFLLIGALSRDWVDTMKNLSIINIKRIFVSSLLCTFIINALCDYFHFSTALMIIICFMTGMWSGKILDTVCNWTLVKIFLRGFFGSIKTSWSKGITDVIDADDNQESNSTNNQEINKDTVHKDNTKDV